MSEESVIKAEVAKKELGAAKLATGLVAAGVVLLAANLLNISLMSFLWPMFIIGPGLLMLWPAYQSTPGNRSKFAFLAVPGAMTLATGVLFFLMNWVNHYESWAYAWTLVLAAGAAGYTYMHRFDESNARGDKAYRFIRAMVLTFMALAVFFEVLVFQSLGIWWPVLLIGLGLYLFVRNKRSVENE
jgi:hypothetical protein